MNVDADIMRGLAPGQDSSVRRFPTVVVDTCRLFREGLVRILRSSLFDVITAEADIQDALPAIDRERSVRPIALLICSLDPQHAIEPQLAAIRAVRERDAATKTVLLMPNCSAEDLVAAVLCGIDGVILKDISSETLISALDLVLHGQHVLPLGIASQIFSRLPAAANEAARPPVIQAAARAVPQEASVAVDEEPGSSVFEAADAASVRERAPAGETRNLNLSERETQILQCLVEGCANKLIARRLNIAEATVKVHIKGLLRKINVSNRTQAAIWALNQSVAVGQPRPDPQRARQMQAVAIQAASLPTLDDTGLLDIMAVFPPHLAVPTVPA